MVMALAFINKSWPGFQQKVVYISPLSVSLQAKILLREIFKNSYLVNLQTCSTHWLNENISFHMYILRATVSSGSIDSCLKYCWEAICPK